MKLEKVEALGQIKKGNVILIDDGYSVQPHKACEVKISEQDGEEVIISKRRNKFFNVEMYLDGHSWVKDVRVVVK